MMTFSDLDRLFGPLTAQQVDLFTTYFSRLEEINAVKNLTRVPQELWEHRHFAESGLLSEFIPPESKVLDIGSGPGLPAVPLAILRPDCMVTAIDSNAKMLSAALKLPNLTTVVGRIEEQDWNDRFNVVTGRALAPLGIQLELSARPCRLGGVIIPFRSEEENADLKCIASLGLKLLRVEIRQVAPSEPKRAFPIYQKVAETPAHYPRAWARIKAKPLT